MLYMIHLGCIYFLEWTEGIKFRPKKYVSWVLTDANVSVIIYLSMQQAYLIRGMVESIVKSQVSGRIISLIKN